MICGRARDPPISLGPSYAFAVVYVDDLQLRVCGSGMPTDRGLRQAAAAVERQHRTRFRLAQPSSTGASVAVSKRRSIASRQWRRRLE